MGARAATWWALVGWSVFVTAIGEIVKDRREQAELERQRELAAAAQAGAAAAIIVRAIVDDLAAAAEVAEEGSPC